MVLGVPIRQRIRSLLDITRTPWRRTPNPTPPGSVPQAPLASSTPLQPAVIIPASPQGSSRRTLAPRKNTCIYRVPRKLRQVSQEAYTPYLVSIGHIHLGHENVTAMENHKQDYLDELCAKSQKQNGELRSQVQNLEEKIRSYYEEYSFVELNSEGFIDMVLLDSAFIIMIMRATYRGKYLDSPQTESSQERATNPPISPSEDYTLSKTWRDFGVMRDLMLLENQLPYFVLEHLYTFAFGNSLPAFYDLACEYFRHFALQPELDERRVSSCCCCCSRVCYITDDRDLEQAHNTEEDHFKRLKEELKNKEFRHFTDMVRTFWSHKHQAKEYKHYFTSVANVFTITELHNAGVMFEIDPEAWPLKMEFVKPNPIMRVLKMPRVTFHDHSECLIRNLMAYEQCHDPYDAYISEFFVFLSFLINSEKDVDLLARKGIITNWLGDNAAVASVVKGLGKQIAEAGNRYHPLYQELNAHCENWFYMTIATLRRVYFRNLWKGTGTIGVVVILVLTLIQTINSFNQNTTVILRHN